jgi:hypothetical protein
MRAEDPRLERRVTIEAAGIHIGELLKRVSEQARVTLVAGDPGDGAADERVSVYLREVPLGDVLESLYSLMSYRSAEWHWRRTRPGGKDAFSYRLVQGRDAQLLGARLDQGVQERFETHAAAMLALLNMDPAERDAYLKKDPVAARLFTGERLRRGLALFADTLAPNQQLDVLRRRMEITVSVEKLSPVSRAFVLDLDRQTKIIENLPDGTKRPLPPPQSVRFSTGHGATLAPRLMIDLALPVAGGVFHSGYGYLGGRSLSEQMMRELAAEWILPGDRRDNALGAVRVTAERKPTDGPIGVEDRLKQLSESVPVALLARLARSLRDPASPSGMTLAEYLDKKLADEPWYLQHKWRGNILLISDPYWFKGRGADRPVPYETVKWLRETQAANDGFLLLPHLAAAAGRLSQNQLISLKGEFPVLASVAHWRPLFALYNSSPVTARRLLSGRGVPLSEALPDPRRGPQGTGESAPSVFSALAGGQFEPFLHPAGGNAAAAIRMRDRADDKAQPPVRRVTVELLSKDGRVLTGGGFFYKQQTPKPPAADPASRPN